MFSVIEHVKKTIFVKIADNAVITQITLTFQTSELVNQAKSSSRNLITLRTTRQFFSLVCFEFIVMIDKMLDDDAEGIENEL